MNDSETDVAHDVKESMEKIRTALLKLEIQLLFFAARNHVLTMRENEKLTRSAMENCKNETVRRWLTEGADSAAFRQLADLFNFLKTQIDEEESKLHSGHIDIIFIAHGGIRGSMIPACCLLPLPTITDVLLYTPWNCVMSAGAAYGVATGRMKPQDRVFQSQTTEGCSTPSEKHHPKNLPERWNSMKQAGDEKIPNIMLSPLEPSEGPKWKKLSQPDRNRIIIPYIGPESAESVPFSIVTLALSLVLLPSRFKATVHLASCLSDTSKGEKFNQEYLKQQYACTVDDTVMTFSPDTKTRDVHMGVIERIRRMFGYAPP